MILKSLFSFCGSGVGGVRLLAYKLLSYLYIPRLFQRCYMAGKVAIGQVKGFLQFRETYAIVRHEHSHYTQPYAVVKCFIERMNEVFQERCWLPVAGYKFKTSTW